MARTSDPVAIVASAFALELPTIVVMATRPSFSIRLSVFAAQFAVVWWAMCNLKTASEGPFEDYSLGGLYCTSLFTALHFYFMTDALSDGTRHAWDTKPAKDMPFFQRLWWSWCLRVSVRGVGWSTEAPHLPAASTKSRWPFVAERILAAIKYYLIVDLAGIYLTTNPIFSSRAHEAKSITSQGLVFQAISGVAYWANLYGSLMLVSSVLSVITVALGIYEPRFWRPMLGNFMDAYNVRRLWGRVWHQVLRRYVASVGKFVAKDVFKFKSGTKFSSYTQLWVGFFVSGSVHVISDRMMDVQVGRSLPFFQIQALAITVEDIVIGLARRAGIEGNHVAFRILGRIWVATWFLYTTPLLSDVATDGGRPWVSGVPFSVVTAAANALGVSDKIQVPWPA